MRTSAGFRVPGAVVSRAAICRPRPRHPALGTGHRTALLAAVLLLLLTPPLHAQGMDSLLAAGQRAARAWRQHDFRGFVGQAPLIAVSLPGSPATLPMRAGQAAELLAAFVEGADEAEVEMMVARSVDPERAYVEIRRVFTSRGSDARRIETLYLGMRRAGTSFVVAEVRVVP